MADVAARVTAVEAALAVGEPWLPPDLVEQARATVDRSVRRVGLGPEHTVVALVGATGSGKSSLFNALARMEIAPVGARRPMTSQPMACVWGEGGSEELLDWLEVPADRRITRESVLDADLQAPLQGLVLLDLPDHDSTDVIHRVEVDRLVTMVDLMVWVVDPQKYADDALHSGYLQRLVGHAGVMVVVLNQIDRLDPVEADTCSRDLRRLLDRDGLERVPMIAVSARRGDGVDALRGLLADVVQDRFAIEERVGADLQAAVDALATGLAADEPGQGEPPGGDAVMRALATAAGIPVVLEAVAAEYRRRGRARTGWPPLQLLRRLTPARLARPGSGVDEDDLKLMSAGHRPVSATVQRSGVQMAVDAAIAASADALPQRWAQAVRAEVGRPEVDLVTALDRGLAGVDLRPRPPAWWWAVAAVQYVLAAAAVTGAIWSVLLGAGSLVGDADAPAGALGLSLPVVLLVAGLLGGALLALVMHWVLADGARRRRALVEGQLADVVRSIVRERVVAPIRLVLHRHRATRLALTGVEMPTADLTGSADLSPADHGQQPDAGPANPSDDEGPAPWAGAEPVAGNGPDVPDDSVPLDGTDGTDVGAPASTTDVASPTADPTASTDPVDPAGTRSGASGARAAAARASRAPRPAGVVYDAPPDPPSSGGPDGSGSKPLTV
jgi:GTP-binding protein EngB required for normal cell division